MKREVTQSSGQMGSMWFYCDILVADLSCRKLKRIVGERYQNHMVKIMLLRRMEKHLCLFYLQCFCYTVFYFIKPLRLWVGMWTILRYLKFSVTCPATPWAGRCCLWGWTLTADGEECRAVSPLADRRWQRNPLRSQLWSRFPPSSKSYWANSAAVVNATKQQTTRFFSVCCGSLVLLTQMVLGKGLCCVWHKSPVEGINATSCYFVLFNKLIFFCRFKENAYILSCLWLFCLSVGRWRAFPPAFFLLILQYSLAKKRWPVYFSYLTIVCERLKLIFCVLACRNIEYSSPSSKWHYALALVANCL